VVEVKHENQKFLCCQKSGGFFSMPTIKLHKKILENLIGKKLSLEKLKDRISYLGTDLESIEGNQINVEIFPNRPDLLSEQGFARAFSSFIGKKTGLRRYKAKKSDYKVIIDKSLKNIRPYTACAIVKNLKFDNEKIKEVVRIQEKLHVTFGRNRKKAAIGIYPFEKIKTPINFIAKKPEEIKFQPLESRKTMNGRQILSQHPAGREYGHLLEGLDKYSIFIDSNNEILSMPPIINSHKTGKITEKTKDIFIECSGFDLNTLKKCLNIIVTTLADMGGEIHSMQLKYPDKTITTPELEPEKMKISLPYINKTLGLNLKENEIKKLLERMGYDYKNKTVYIPAYRADIIHQMDIAEDIAIAYGYENFKEEIPNISTVGEEDQFEKFKSKCAETMVGLNLLEVSSYHLTNKEISKAMNFTPEMIEVEKSSSEYNLLRTWLIPNLIKIFGENKRYEYPQKIFEIGTIFKKNNKTETNTEEITRIAFTSTHKKANFTEAKQIMECFLSNLDLKCKITEKEHPSFISGRTGRVTVNNKKVGYIGEIHPKVLNNFSLKLPVAAFELNLTEIFKEVI